MYYQVPVYRQATNFERRVRRVTYQEILPNIPDETWKDSLSQIPLRYSTDPLTIVSCCLPHCDGSYKTNAVYILECLQLESPKNRLMLQKGRARNRWNDKKAQTARKVIYVGSTISLLRRLDEHINDPEDSGAYFTSVYPPIRILDVSWYRSYSDAEKAEKIIAGVLSEELENDYIYQQ